MKDLRHPQEIRDDPKNRIPDQPHHLFDDEGFMIKSKAFRLDSEEFFKIIDEYNI